MKKVLVFGCGGFVGKYLAEEFWKHGYQVFGSGHSEADHCLKQYVARYEIMDLMDFDSIEKYITEVQPDYIINLAALSSVALSWSQPQKTVEVNLIGSINILETVKKLDIHSKVMLVGSSEEYSISAEKIAEDYPTKANNPYGMSKVVAEQFSDLYRKEYGLNIVSTRTFNHTGVGQPDRFAIPSFVKQVAEIHKSGKPGVIKVGNLNAHRDLGDVRDMVSAYRMILESDTKEHVFNVGSGTCYCLKDILDYIISLSNQEITVEVDPDKIRPIDNPIIWCDNSKIKKEIGWEPKYTIYDAINEMFKAMTSDGK